MARPRLYPHRIVLYVSDDCAEWIDQQRGQTGVQDFLRQLLTCEADSHPTSGDHDE